MDDDEKKKKKLRNPTLSAERWSKLQGSANGQPMTMNGALMKTLLLSLIMITTFFATIWYVHEKAYQVSIGLFIALSIFELIVVIIACVNPKTSPLLAPVYSIVEGALLGGVVGKNDYVMEATVITMVIFFTLLILYRVRIIRVTSGFVKLICGLTLGIVLFYGFEFILLACGVVDGNIIFGHGIIAILLGLLCLFVAVSNILVDFWSMEEGANAQLPKYMEWYFGLGLMISIVWVYLEILNLLTSLNRN